MDNNNQQQADQGQLSPQAVKRNQMYRVAYLGTGVLALIIYYGLPAIFPIAKDTAERFIILLAVPYFFFNAYVASHWSGTVSETLTYAKTQRPWVYKLWQFRTLGLQTAEKPFMPYTGLLWIVLGIGALIWFFVTL